MLAAEPELDKAVALLGDPGFATLSPLTVAAWGRRPKRQARVPAYDGDPGEPGPRRSTAAAP
jgi:hypothetical protein